METKVSQTSISKLEFMELIKKARESDQNAMMEIIKLYENEMIYLSRYIKMPKEDALQAMILGLIELIKRGEIND
ncbi:helix-turn-helix domain-containing protein [Paenibacillus thiaminolyticus]|uniref:helix-turn-helix domain-containing protein n=1 Tax=Paenibacillus thiaminolyticus TaxID=49283 RepID=UPI00232D9D31|nr:helix-turn-helix domain-containing protein [Paenibacillus thiaminolyticus]WCF09219.1 helix-turn-helix domain-containing protein [Paenibacillus thiaminolyticus]